MPVATRTHTYSATRALALALLVAAVPAAASAKTIMVIVPHEYDETLLAAGVMRAAVSRGDTVKIVLLTNGDGNVSTEGPLREGQSVTAAGLLGIAESDVIFLGYGERALQGLYNAASPTVIIPSPAGFSATYATRGYQGKSYHATLGPAFVPADYTRNNLKSDLHDVIAQFTPAEIYTLSVHDWDSDHSATAAFVAEVLAAARASGETFAQVPVYEGLIVQPFASGSDTGDWPCAPGALDASTPGFTPAFPLQAPPNLRMAPLDWSRAVRFEVPAAMRSPDSATNLKYQAIQAFGAYADAHLACFARRDEVFWLHDFRDNVAVTATASVSSVDALVDPVSAGTNAIDGIVSGGPFYPSAEWRAASASGQCAAGGTCESITLTWPSPGVTISQVNLYDRIKSSYWRMFDETDDILDGKLEFSSGDPIQVGALPPGGQVLPVTFPNRTVTWVKFTIQQATGVSTGLTEIEVLGKPSGSVGNTPPMFLRAPRPMQDPVASGATVMFTTEALDLDGDTVTVTWTDELGATIGTGPSVLVTAPTVSAPTVLGVTATLSDGTATAASTAYVTVLPTLATLTVQPGFVVGGGAILGTIALPAPAGQDIGFNVASDNTAFATVDPAGVVTILAGNNSASFPIATSATSSQRVARIYASSGVDALSATLMIEPSTTLTVSDLAVSPSTVGGGSVTRGVVWLNTNPGVAGATVYLSSSDTAVARVPPSVILPDGDLAWATFPIWTSRVGAATDPTITAVIGGSSKTAKVYVRPNAVVGLALSTLTAAPGTVTGTVKLRYPAGVDGYTVSLASSDTAIADVAAATVTVPEGQSSATFTVTAKTAGSAWIRASGGGTTAPMLLTVTGP